MKRVLSLILVIVLVLLNCQIAFAESDEHNAPLLISPAPQGFYDIGTQHYAYNAAKNLFDNGFISGEGEGRLYPNDNITREEAVKIALTINKVEIEQGLTVSAPDFDKVSPWAKDVIATAYKYGVIRGDEDGKLRPTEYVTRAELVAIAIRAININISNITVEFTDVPESSWYFSYIGTASRLGLIGGYQDGTFKPENKIIRADSFVVFNNMFTLRTALENA